MYNELELIKSITCIKTKARLLILFIEEYAMWLQHLNTVGLKWGVNGEEMGANKEAVKCRNHLNILNNELLNLAIKID